MLFQEPLDRDTVKRNLYKQGTKVLRAIVEQYDSGFIESPEDNHLFMSLMAMVCEGRVTGKIDKTTGKVAWNLTPAFKEEVSSAVNRVRQTDNVVNSPWK